MIQRIRTIKPELYKHDLLWRLEQTTMLPLIRLYPALWTCTDREARFEWKPRELKVDCCPYDVFDFEHVLNAFANAGFVVKYIVDGRLYGWIPRFLNHQNLNNRERPSRLPAPPADAIAEHERRMLLFDFNVLPAREALIAPPVLLSEHPSQRVGDAPVTREAPVNVAPSSEQNGTEQNGTERETTEIVESAAPTSTPATGAGGAVALIRSPSLPAVRGKAIAVNVLARLTAVFEDIRSGARAAVRGEQLETLQADFIITYWAHKHDHPNTIIDEKRRRKVRERLKENGGDVNELLFAVDGAKHDKHLMGENNRDRKYDGISTIFRDREMVERLANNRPKFKRGEQHAMLAKWSEIVAQESAR